jgi:hypothetical protein
MEFPAALQRIVAVANDVPDPQPTHGVGVPLRQLPGALRLEVFLIELFWPMAFEERIVEAAKRAGIDPLVMVSIARRESRYDPGVRSVVGAIGLFQFMPYTAAELAAPAGLTDVSEAALKTPHAASRLAATYLRAAAPLRRRARAGGGVPRSPKVPSL